MLVLYQKYPKVNAVDSAARTQNSRFMARHLSQFLAGFSLNTGVRHASRLTGGENAHFFPVIGELSAAIQADYIGSRVRRRFTATLSPFAGLGKADAFVPATEQSVKNLHHLLPRLHSVWALAFALLRNLRKTRVPVA